MKVIPKKAVEWMMMSSENILLEVELLLHQVFPPFQNLRSSMQRNFMASKSFKVGFSMNIKMMLFQQFVTGLHFEFCLLFAPLLYILQCQISSNVKYGLLLQNCKVKHSSPRNRLSFS